MKRAIVLSAMVATLAMASPVFAQTATLPELLKKDFDIVTAFKDQADIVLILRNADQVFKCTALAAGGTAKCELISK